MANFNKEFKFLLTKEVKRINFSKMTFRSLILLASGAALLSGCATLNEKDKVVEGLNRQITDLRTSLNDTNSKLDELGSRFILLNEKLDASNQKIEKLSHVSPPEGLAVVELSDAEQKQAIAEPHKAEQKAEELKLKPESGPKLEIKESKESKDKEEKADKIEKKAEAATPDAMYKKGQDFFIGGRYAEARKVFADFVSAYPGHNLSDNALYWVGESYYTEKDFEKAAARFKEVFDRYPGENKAPDALLKTGFSYLEMNDADRAKDALERLVKRYPGTDAAAKAKKTLDKLSGAKKEGSR